MAVPLILYPHDTGRRFFYCDELVDVDAKAVIDHAGQEVALFHIVWRADGNGDGGEIEHYPVEPHSQRKWLLLLEYLHGARAGIDWARYLEPARAQLAPNLDPLSRQQLENKYRLLSLEDLQKRPPPRWVVDGHIPLGGLAVLYGPSGSGKSFLALDLALCVAANQPWMGQDVMSGPVVYVAAEGMGGMQQRVEAWRFSRPTCDPSGIRFVEWSVNMLDEQDVTTLLAALADLPIPPALTVIDTLARCLVGGDENAARDMGLFIAAVDRIRAATGGTVLVVHHTGKNGDAERGSSALRGAADTMIAVTNDDGLIRIQCDKQKDAPEFERVYARLVTVGDSAFIGKDAGIAVSNPDSPLSRQERAVVDVLTAIFGEDGATPSQLINQARIPERTIFVVLKNLTARQLIRKQGSGRSVRYFAANSTDCKLQ